MLLNGSKFAAGTIFLKHTVSICFIFFYLYFVRFILYNFQIAQYSGTQKNYQTCTTLTPPPQQSTYFVQLLFVAIHIANRKVLTTDRMERDYKVLPSSSDIPK